MGWPLCSTVSAVMRGCSLYTAETADSGDGDENGRGSAVYTGSTTPPRPLTGLDSRQGQKPAQSWVG